MTKRKKENKMSIITAREERKKKAKKVAEAPKKLMQFKLQRGFHIQKPIFSGGLFFILVSYKSGVFPTKEYRWTTNV